MRLNWSTPDQRQADHAAAIDAARHAKMAVVFVWARRAPAFVLPGDQDALVEAVAAVNPNTVVVLNTSQPVAMPWAARVKAILEMWWPGDEGGWATAKLLIGKANPAGRLPVTWAKALSDYPADDPRHPERSSAGLDVGYRGFDREGVKPLFTFGHGLSYSHFVYSHLSAKRAPDGGLDLAFRIHNTGPVDGDEVPQAYLGAPANPLAGIAFPVRKLIAFDRVNLKAGETKTVRLHAPARQLQSWSVARHAWITALGPRTVSVGASSRDLRVKQGVDIQ